MKKLLSLCLMSALLLVGCGSNDKKDDNKLVFLTNSGYPPYEMVDNDGVLYGFDIDVITKAAEIAGYEVEVKDVEFDAIVPSVKTGKADGAIAGMTPSKKRKESVDFSDVYYSGEDSQNYLLYSEKSGIKTQADLKGKTIGCQMGTVQYEAALHFEDEVGAKVDAKKDYASILAEINKGKNDCAIVEKAVAEEFIKKNPDYKSFKIEGLAALEGNAMCFKKGSPLVKEFNKAIQTMIENGDMDQLVDKWFNNEK